MKKTILITGGHLTPAVAVIKEMKRVHPDWVLKFAGRLIALDEGQIEAEERTVVKQLGVDFIPLAAGRLKSKSLAGLISVLPRFLNGLWEAQEIVAMLRPDAVVSFGGYVALPVVLSARMNKIPVLSHEQTAVPGLSNRIIARIATVMCVAHEETKRFFPRQTKVTGNPLRREILADGMRPVGFPVSELPIIYVAGGTTGSRFLNEAVAGELPGILAKYVLVHQTGRQGIGDALKNRALLAVELKKRYFPFPYLEDPVYAWVLHHAALYIGRSGANTTHEIGLFGIPSVFVPLPGSSGGEQEQNARMLVGKMPVQILKQDQIKPGSLNRIISSFKLIPVQRSGPGKLVFAQEKIVRLVEKITDKKNHGR